MATFEEFLNERNITLKRRYTENHPAKTVGGSARVRNAIIEALKDGKITVEEFNNIVSQHSSAPSKWTKGNKRFFKIEEDGISLSTYGQKILTSLVTESVDEGLNKSDVAYQLATDYTGRTKPKITKLNKKRLEIKYGYKISPETVIDSIKKVHPEVELKHVEWSDKMTGGGFHIFDILESAITEGTYDSKDHIGSTSDGQGSNAEIYKKGRGYYVVVSGEHDYDFEAKNDKELINKLEEYEFDSSDILESIVTENEVQDLDMEDMNPKMAKQLLGMASKQYKNEFQGSYTVDKGNKKMRFDTYSALLAMVKQKDSGPYGPSYGINIGGNNELEDFEGNVLGKLNDKSLSSAISSVVKAMKIAAKNSNESVVTVYTNFQQFVNESVELNEALKSSKLRGLLTMKRGSKQILKAIYGFSKIELDKITDDQIIDIDPKLGKKTEGLVVYYTTQEKDNPYADTSKSVHNSANRIPANTILALGMGKDVAYIKRDYIKRKMTMSLTTDPRKSSHDIGINKEYRGWDASGIYNVKRVIDVADAAFVINTAALPNTKGKIEDRIKAKEGAVSFKSDKEFKDANLARYKEILQKRASELPLDKLVMDAIDDATGVMKDGLKNQEKNKYGELIAGVGTDGRAYKLNDISNFINALIQDYERWSGYMAEVETAEAKYGKDSREYEWQARYAEKESQEYAKSIKDRLAKLKKRNLAW
jgi:hypothetical protein